MTKYGIDVSYYQGKIDWEKVKNRIDFAIIRCGYGRDLPSQDDPQFKRNADECTRLGIPFGVYLYSYAQNEIDALSEAKHIMRLVAEYKMEYPIYLDLEDPRIMRLDNSQIEKNCRVWAEELEKNKYFPGFYGSYYWWKTKLTGVVYKRYTRWVARYAQELGVEGFDMWQYSDRGFVEGINTSVDMNYSFRDFPSEIKAKGYNNFDEHINPDTKYQVGDYVTFNRIYISSESKTPLVPYINNGTITRIVRDANNPYLIDNGLGWVNDDSIINNERYISNLAYQGDSLVKALDEVGYDSSMNSRKNLSFINGIDNYVGSAKQNLFMLQLLKDGRLKC